MENVVAHHHPSLIHDDHFIEITENEESPKEESRVPEGIGNPRIQVIIVRRREIIGHHRRSQIVVIIAHDARANIVRIVLWRFAAPLLYGVFGCHRKAKFADEIFKGS
jgi:hypothetical protein